MGIRIQKQLGYALTDFKYSKSKWEATDPRVNLDLFNGDQGEALHIKGGEFIDWATSNPREVESYIINVLGLDTTDALLTRMMLEEIPPVKFPIGRMLTHSPEFGLPNVLLFQPLNSDEFTRYGDYIDTYDALVRGERKNTVEDLTEYGGITPGTGFMFRHPDKETPEKFLNPEVASVGAARNGVRVRDGIMPVSVYQTCLQLEASGMGSEDKDNLLAFQEHLRNDWGCNIPTEILVFAHWAEIFKDFNTVYRLKPVLYTHWT